MTKREYTDDWGEASVSQPVYNLTDKQGNVVDTTNTLPEGMREGQTHLYRNKTTGSLSATPTAFISLNKDTGNIEIKAPQSVLDSDIFKRNYQENETLQQISQAYKLNKDAKIPMMVTKEDGTKEEQAVSIDEAVAKLNEEFTNKDNGIIAAIERVKDARPALQTQLSSMGVKNTGQIDSFGDTDIVMSLDYNNGIISLPGYILDAEVLSDLLPKIDENGRVSAEDFHEFFYTRDRIDKTSLAAFVNRVRAGLEQPNVDAEIENENGEKEANPYSVGERAKGINLLSYIYANDPTTNLGYAWQDWNEAHLETWAFNVVKGAMNLASGAEGLFTDSTVVRDAADQLEKFDQINREQWTLINDATVSAFTVGDITGTITTMFLFDKLGGAILGAVGKTGGAILNKASSTVSKASATLAAGEKISAGAQILVKMNSAAQNAKLLSAIKTGYESYQAFMGSHRGAQVLQSFLLDTLHDAFIMDGNALRHAMESSDQATRDFWLDQLKQNAVWWVGFSGARAAVRGSRKGGSKIVSKIGETNFGQKLNAYSTIKINKLSANLGIAKTKLKNYFADINPFRSGDYLEKLQTKYDTLGDGIRKNRVANKIRQTEDAYLLRNARKSLGDMDLKIDADGRITKESAAEFTQKTQKILALEDAIDSNARGIQSKRAEMISQVKDPVSGEMVFLNPTLGGANVVAGNSYLDLADLIKRSGMSLDASDGFSNQKVINYQVRVYQEGLFQSFSEASGENAAKAAGALEIVRKDLDNLRKEIPESVRLYVDENIKAYTDFYAELNEYGMSKGLLDVEKTTSYMENPIWKENGYMPVVAENNVNGKWISDDGRISNMVDQDMKELTFNTYEGQNFVDPELVRQARIDNMAKAELNSDKVKAYLARGDNATNNIVISAEETQYVSKLNNSKQSLDKAITDYSASIGEYSEFVTVQKGKNPRNRAKRLSAVEKNEAIAGLSYKDTQDVLYDRGILNSDNPTLSSRVNRSNYEDWYDDQSKSVKNYLALKYNDLQLSGWEGFRKAVIDSGEDFEAGLQRAFLAGDDKFMKSGLINEAIKNQKAGKDAFYEGVTKAQAKAELANVKGIKTDSLVDDMEKAIRDGLDDITAGAISNPGAKKAIETLAESTDGGDVMAKYVTLRRLEEDGIDKFHEIVDNSVDSILKGSGIDIDDAVKVKKSMRDMADGILENEIADASMAARTINPELVDSEYLFDKVKKLDAEIRSADAGIKSGEINDMIVYTDEFGREIYSQVDPIVASLYNYRLKMTKAQASMIAKMNAVTSKMFRYGTTSVNLKAMSNQLWRDFGGAIGVGGAWNTIKTSADNMVDVFGENVVDQIKRFDPRGYEIRQTEAFSRLTGQSIEEAGISREMSRAAIISPSTTERELYRDFMAKAYGSGDNLKLENLKKKLQQYNPMEKLDDLMNGKRETYLRNRVYANNYNKALTAGYTIQEARNYAEFFMNNATTNFSRQLYHLQSIADSTPYFRAAINAKKSFYRAFSIDPVGISGRMLGGLVFPSMALIGASLISPRDRAIYQAIPEYEKDTNLVVVVRGQVLTLPMPQELMKVVSPFRQFVEYLHGANKNDFWELMMNDALGLAPIDLSGFSTIDVDNMINEPTFMDRMERGFSRIFSSTAPVPIKSAYILIRQRDPYTGKLISNPNKYYWNSETGSYEVMNYSENAFANVFADAYNNTLGSLGLPKISPFVAEKVISGVVGSSMNNVLDDLATMAQKGISAGWGRTLANATNSITAPYTGSNYDQVQAEWRRAVRELELRKEQITSSNEWAAYNEALAKTTDPEERKKIINARQNMINEYQQQVLNTVKRLQEVKGGEITRERFFATVQLLNFDGKASYQDGTQYSSDLVQDMLNQNKEDAYRTMVDLGFTGTTDLSIFGYLYRNRKTGKIEMAYSSPLAILDLDRQWSNRNDIHLANIEAMLKRENIWDLKDEVDEQIEAIYNKKDLTDDDYKKINELEVDWNTRIMKMLAPYIEEMTPEQAINNSKVLNYLGKLIKVPSDFKKDKYGRWVTNKKLNYGSANDAYMKNYIRRIWKINDTGSKSGKNWRKIAEEEENAKAKNNKK